MSRRGDFDIAFGSDSFLDVIANIVGILIILIVLVGLRVKNAPLPSAGPAESADEAYLAKRRAWEEDRKRIDEENLRRRSEHERSTREYQQELDRRAQLEREHARRVEQARRDQSDHDERLRRRQQEIDEADAETAQLLRAIAELTSQVSAELRKSTEETSRRHAELIAVGVKQAEFDRMQSRIDAESKSNGKLTADVAALQAEIEALRKRLAELPAPKPIQNWRHFGAPLSRRVAGSEAHFRCLQGRIVDVQLDRLLDEVKKQIETLDVESITLHTGTVGPIRDFRMTYVLQRAKSFSEQLTNPFVAPVQLVGWEIWTREKNLGELQEAALADGSAFRQAITEYPPHKVTITLWVYPDSFALAKAVQEFLHGRGYQVALRPLPAGLPIAGSPWGSASRAQ